jgi:hypothetical protein
MQLTVRSYLMAGLAAAGAGALAIAPMPSLTSDVSIPTVEAPVALAAAPSFEDLLALGLADTTLLVSTPFSSGSSANTFLGYDTQVIGAQLGALATAVQADPETYLPLAAASVGFLPLSLVSIAEPQFTGVNAAGVSGNPSNPTYTLPGQAATTSPILTTTPPYLQNVPTVVAPINAATTKVAGDFDNVSAALGGPKLAKPITTGAQAIGTSVVQAQGLVRTAVVGTAQGATLAALSGNPQGVATAFQTGASNIQKSIVGDPSVPLVNPATGKVSTNTSLNTAAPVKRLGAIGTVSSTVQKAASDVGNSISGGS